MILSIIISVVLGIFQISDKPNEYVAIKDSTTVNHSKIINKTNKKLNTINRFSERRTKRHIRKLNRIEYKIFKELCKIDEVAAEQFYLKPSLNSSYTIKNNRLDSLNVLHNYYSENENYRENNLNTTTTSKIQKENSNKQANYRNKRKLVQILADKHPSLAKQSKKYSKEIFYYNQQVGEYSKIIKKSTFIKDKDLKRLFEDQSVADFFKSSRQPIDLSKVNKGENLQTNQSVKNAINEKVDLFNLKESDIIQSTNKLKKHKRVLKQYSNLNNASDIPDFKPNLQKAKRFKDRLSYVFDISNLPELKKSNNGFTASGGVLYKMNNRFETGFGINYNQPVAEIYKFQKPDFKPYVVADHNVKGKFFLSMNFITIFSVMKEDTDANISNASQNSSLLGGIKVYQNNTNSKVYHGIYYDFLNSKYKTTTLPLIYKVGYKF